MFLNARKFYLKEDYATAVALAFIPPASPPDAYVVVGRHRDHNATVNILDRAEPRLTPESHCQHRSFRGFDSKNGFTLFW